MPVGAGSVALPTGYEGVMTGIFELNVGKEADTTGIFVLSVGTEADISERVVLKMGLEAETTGAALEGAGTGAVKLAGRVMPLRAAQTLTSSF